LAGNGAGLEGDKSNVFWSFWRLITELAGERRKPRAIVIENVRGLITSRNGQDFQAICRALSVENYRIGGFVMDACHFVPQSRPRLFLVGLLEEECTLPESASPIGTWHPDSLRAAVERFPSFLASCWNWWELPAPPIRNTSLADLLEDNTDWHPREKTEKLLDMMSPVNRSKIDDRLANRHKSVGAAFRRTRLEHGNRRQRIEVRFDGLAGCLRTPGGGSSRQTIFSVGCGEVKSRLLTPRETARLMGLSDQYKLPENPNDAFQLSGDGVAVPVVEFLANNILKPALANASSEGALRWQKSRNSVKV
jgi:DNA (cytosine-5)-methyltransferase 1